MNQLPKNNLQPVWLINSRMIAFCKNCADKEMETWKGWPGKNPIPPLPIFTHGNYSSYFPFKSNHRASRLLDIRSD